MMKKRMLSLLLVLFMLTGLITALPITASAATSGTCGTNLTWTLDSAGTLTISGTGAMTNWSSVSSLPWYSNRSSIKKVVIGNSVTTIGDWAFNSCSSLTAVTIGDSVTTIGYAAFSYCFSLTAVTIPDSVTTIGDGAFSGCDSLTNITVTSNNSHYTDIEGVLFNKNKTTLIQYPGGKTATSYTIPDSVTTIGASAFYDCDSLTTVTIPDSVTSIGNSAFRYCHSLTTVTIPDSVTAIGVYAFSSCDSLTTVTIPDSVTTIGTSAFYHCSSLTTVTIGNSVTTIGAGAFYSCDSLTTVTISDSVTTIGDWAFCYCFSLTTVTIPDSVTTIGAHAFYCCSSLTTVTIPDSVTTIGVYAFYSCDSLTDVYYTSSEAKWKEINIQSGNNRLTDATIHYNYDAVAAKFQYSQQAISGIGDISGYKEYMKNASKEFVVPGLKEGMVPQGLAYREDTDEFYITAYDGANAKASVLMVVDAKSGKYIKEYNIVNENGNPIKGHLGGVAVAGNNIYLAEGKSLLRIPLSSIDKMQRYGNLKVAETIPLSLGDANLAYVSYDRENKMLWTGNFYYFWNDDYNTKAHKDYNTLLMGYKITENTSNGFYDSQKAWSTSSYSYIPHAVCDMNDFDRIQGLAFSEEGLVLSQSFGRNNKSTLYFFKSLLPHQADKTLTIDGVQVPLCEPKKLNKITTLPMSEGMDIRRGMLYTIFESAAQKYLDGGEDKTDSVWGYRLENYTGKNCPILVLPGIMGSTLYDTEGVGVPVLTDNSKPVPRGNLVIADTTAANTGANDLIKKLEALGEHKVYPCPYDWRLSIEEIAAQYLKPLIREAKEQTGSDKVIIVAHSMGGLVARHYIQSADYQNDVDSLYMIGTPNDGSSAMIPLAEFGVPYDAAQATVMSYNYNKMTGEDFNKATYKEVKHFINKKVLSTSQLLPAYRGYYYNVETDSYLGEGLNDYLKALNEEALTCGRYQPMSGLNKNKVRTILFASEELLDTPSSLAVVYNGNIPDLKYTGSFLKNKGAYMAQAAVGGEPYVDSVSLIGDGTVLTKSAILSGRMKNIWTIDIGDYGKHMKMFGRLADTIASYLDSMPNVETFSLDDGELVEETPVNTLQIDVSGGEAFISVGEDSINLDGGCYYDENVSDGEYVINCVKNETGNRITVQLLYTTGDSVAQETLSFLNDENAVTFKIADGVLEFENKKVSHIRSVNAEGVAKLLWDANEKAAAYRIYTKSFEGTEYTLISETTETEYITGDAWLNDFAEDCICYYVVPVFADGTEGGYSEGARNYNTAQAFFECAASEGEKTVTFTDLSTGDIASWEWDFNNDGIVDSTEQNPVYTYGQDGVYDVTLTVSGASGTSMFTGNDVVKIGTYPMELVIEAEAEEIKIGESTTLSAHILMSDESRMPADEVTFRSEDDAVLSVDGNTAKAQKLGFVNVVASANGLTDCIELCVINDKVNISVSAEGYGVAEGSGDYQVGETVLVSAVPVAKEEFLGWYRGEELVSAEKDFWFEVKEAVTLQAVFTTEGSQFVHGTVQTCRYDTNQLYAKITYEYIFKDCTAFVAIYDENGKLQTMTSQDVEKNTAYSEIGLPTATDLTGYSYKVFFWNDETTMEPVGERLEGTVK